MPPPAPPHCAGTPSFVQSKEYQARGASWLPAALKDLVTELREEAKQLLQAAVKGGKKGGKGGKGAGAARCCACGTVVVAAPSLRPSPFASPFLRPFRPHMQELSWPLFRSVLIHFNVSHGTQ